jgi:Ca2+-binding RTX toxin-like protein
MSIEQVYGSAFSDVLLGDEVANRFLGWKGHDIIDGRGQAVGTFDVADFRTSTVPVPGEAGVFVDLAAGLARDQYGFTDILRGIEGAIGSIYADTLLGDGGANTLAGDAGNDTLIGGAGNDSFGGDGGVDLMVGGDGDDVFQRSGFGGGFIDIVDGGAGDDTLLFVGDETRNIVANSLDLVSRSFDLADLDIRLLADGRMVVDNLSVPGFDGVDRATVVFATDIEAVAVQGGPTYRFGGQANLLVGGAGHDTLSNTSGGEGALWGGAGDDLLTGGAFNDLLVGGGGIDTLFGAGGDDTLYVVGSGRMDGGAGNDLLRVDPLRESGGGIFLAGGADFDRLQVLGGARLLGARFDTSAGPHIQLLFDHHRSFVFLAAGQSGGPDIEQIAVVDGPSLTLTGATDGGSGADLVLGAFYGAAPVSLTGGEGDDIVVSTNQDAFGGTGDDVLHRVVPNALFQGLRGVTFAGGDGNDTASYAGASHGAGVTADLTRAVWTIGGQSVTDNLVGIENLTGGDGNDMLTGDAGANVLDGGQGVNLLVGGDGDDTYLVSRSGTDTIDDMSGQDVVVFAAPPSEELRPAYVSFSRDLAGSDLLFGYDFPISRIVGHYTGRAVEFVAFHAEDGITVYSLQAGTTPGNGGAGNDLVVGTGNSETIRGFAGRDAIYGNGGTDLLFGDDGDDDLRGSGTLDGGRGDDVIVMTGAGLALGGEGDDELELQSGDGILDGGTGDDFFDVAAGTQATIRDTLGADLLLWRVDVRRISGIDYQSDMVTLEAALSGSSVTFRDPVRDADGAVDFVLFDPDRSGSGVESGFIVASSPAGGTANEIFFGGEPGSGTVSGGAGNDILFERYGGPDNDGSARLADGGAGDDILFLDGYGETYVGGGGADIFRVSSHFRIASNVAFEGGIDWVLPDLGAGDTVLMLDRQGIDDAQVPVFEISGVFDGTNAGMAVDNAPYFVIDLSVPGDHRLFYDDDRSTPGYALIGRVGSAADARQASYAVLGDDDARAQTGEGGPDTLLGRRAVDTLDGAGGADTLYGFGGDDMLVGGPGNDTLDGGSGTDVADYRSLTTGLTGTLATTGTASFTAADDDVDVLIAIEVIESGSGNDRLTGNAADNRIAGNDGDDVLAGGAGDDDIDGGPGLSDNLDGGDGDDVIRDDDGTSLVRGGAGNDDILLQFTTGFTGSNSFLQGGEGNDTISVTFSGQNISNRNFAGDRHTGSDRDAVDPGDGDDTVVFHGTWTGSNIALNLNGGNDIFRNLGSSAIPVHGGAGADLIQGGSANESLFGNSGDDTLEGGTGNDTLDGGSGSDTAAYAYRASALVATLASSGTVTINVGSGDTDVLIAIENVLGGSGNDTLVGDAAVNRLAGWSGDDLLSGGGDNDNLDGGAGVDTADYGYATGALTATLDGAGTATVVAGTGDTDTLISIENVVGGSGHDVLFGDGGANGLNGGGGNDTLRGGAGNDLLDGASGNDTADYGYLAAGAALSATLNAATTVILAVGDADTDTLVSIENVSGGGGNDWLTGDGGGNRITGGAGNDILSGGAGNDFLSGGSGDDILAGDDGDDSLSGSAGVDTLSGGAGNDNFGTDADGFIVDYSYVTSTSLAVTMRSDQMNTVTVAIGDTDTLGYGVDAIVGGALGDTLVNLGIDRFTLAGGGGDDTLQGGSRADRLDGGDGNDTAFYGHLGAFAGVTATLDSAGTLTLALGATDIDTLVSIENIVGGNGNDLLAGDSAGNRLHGGGGDDRLRGGFGDDVLDGGSGQDTADYDYTTVGITISLEQPGGFATRVTVSLGETDELLDIENLTGGSGNDSFRGNTIANVLTGGDGDDRLDGGGGSDTLSGGAGNDVFILDLAHSLTQTSDALFAGSGEDLPFLIDLGPGDVLSLFDPSLPQETFSFPPLFLQSAFDGMNAAPEDHDGAYFVLGAGLLYFDHNGHDPMDPSTAGYSVIARVGNGDTPASASFQVVGGGGTVA